MDAYTVLKVIGEGSFGRALLVQANNESQQYVMKEIHLSKNPSGLQRSRREAILLAKMKHPNIVTFIDSFEAEGHLYIVMEYCDGGDLTEKLLQQKEKLLPEETVLNLFVQICLGMKHIHDKRVLHRDIKSKNIFLTKTGVVKLGDFGSAHLLNSDIWALGCVLYELCTLRHPFQSNSWKNLILKICKGTYTPIPRHYSYELQYIIKRMFKRNPKDRPSVSTILARNCFAKLINKFLSPEMVKKEFCEVKAKKKIAQDKCRRIVKASIPSKCEDVSPNAGGSANMETTKPSPDVRKWNPAEGESIAKSLAQKALEETASHMEVIPKGDHVIIQSGKTSCSVPGRKKWGDFPPATVLNILENAKLTSNLAVEDVSSGDNVTIYPKSNPRKRWSQHPPETVLNFLRNVNSNFAFKTYTIDKGASGAYLIGPLSPAVGKADNVDGEMETIELDPERLEPRSDDEDTDFEEADEPDWVDELKNLLEDNL
ncbi:serine/threonine-protein kinase Nek3 isoform X2 [Stegostoma tigrinum]|uniref:serine/threonine-protein kinase Nek3 isoform X2 n=1 Tax=Stegostoma tigrinum TaxID=3053191 RepID=UPI00202AEC42|nr:serine/threonine-protein kinase Nek3 isoform X2 [Stegostoma tigrinum]